MGTAAGGTASKVSNNHSTLKKSRHQLSPIIHTEKRPRNPPTHSTLASKKQSIKQTPQPDSHYPYTEKKKYTKMENYDQNVESLNQKQNAQSQLKIKKIEMANPVYPRNRTQQRERKQQEKPSLIGSKQTQVQTETDQKKDPKFIIKTNKERKIEKALKYANKINNSHERMEKLISEDELGERPSIENKLKEKMMSPPKIRKGMQAKKNRGISQSSNPGGQTDFISRNTNLDKFKKESTIHTVNASFEKKSPPKFISNEDLKVINKVPRRGDIEISGENEIADEVPTGEQINIITPGRIGMDGLDYGQIIVNDQQPRQHSHRKI